MSNFERPYWDWGPSEWEALYAGDSDLPSIPLLAERLRCHPNTVRAYLRRHGVAIRGMEEQHAIEQRRGRTRKDRGLKPWRTPPGVPWRLGHVR